MVTQWCRYKGVDKLTTSIPSRLITLHMNHIVAAHRDCHTQKHPVHLNNKLATMKAGQVKKSVHHIVDDFTLNFPFPGPLSDINQQWLQMAAKNDMLLEYPRFLRLS